MAAFGGAPHQSAALTASPRGETPLSCIEIVSFYRTRLKLLPKGFSLEGEAVENRFYGTDFRLMWVSAEGGTVQPLPCQTPSANRSHPSIDSCNL